MTPRDELMAVLRRMDFLFRVRPMPLAELLVKVLAPSDRRRVLDTAAGVKMFVDPLSNLGRALTLNDDYESEVVALFRREVKPGATVVDVGANEGFYAALAGTLAGERGRVVAVEPQSRLQGLLEVNLRLNGVTRFSLVHAALGPLDGSAPLFLAPSLNHGASSFVKRSAFWLRTERVRTMTAAALFESQRIERADLVKVDVEGFEAEVVETLLPLCRDGRVQTLLLDYHAAVLEQRGLSPARIHAQLLGAGMHADGEVRFDSYAIYRRT